MGLLLSYFGYSNNTGRTDDPDPFTGLTSRDKYLIRTSWDIVMKDSTGNGIKLFLKLFEIDVKYKETFPFRDVSCDQLANNKAFQAHCNTVMYSFASIVSTLDNPEVLISINEKIGIAHAKREVDERALRDVKDATLSILSFLSQEHIAAWEETARHWIQAHARCHQQL